MSVIEDEALKTLRGTALEPDARGVVYRLDRSIGHGGLGMAFLALRDAPEGVAPVVIKIIRPSVVASSGPTAATAVRKEVVALGRLNERVPPTPFVVRFIDTGVLPFGTPIVKLPWIAIEYVHGGVEGTTLQERVSYACEKTGYAFEPERAAHALRCLSLGLQAVHDVGVVHRDLTPNNVLCCSFGEAEIFKLSDFGLARAGGMVETFGNVILGTAGYAAPEQSFPDTVGAGPHSDVFGLACVLYLALTGERYFDVTTVIQALVAARDGRRRTLIEGEWLCPELRARPEACGAIDAALARATAYDPRQRPQRPDQLAALIMPWLTGAPDTVRASPRLLSTLVGMKAPARTEDWVWTVRHPPGDERVVRSVGWDGDGHCLVTSTSGLQFWNGTGWLAAPAPDAYANDALFARRIGPATWLLGGRNGTLFVFTSEGVGELMRSADPELSFVDAAGRFDDVLVAVGHPAGGPPALWTLYARRWQRSVPLLGVASVSRLLRLDDARWLVCGRSKAGAGFAATFTPHAGELAPLPMPATRAFIAAASQPDRRVALLCGAEGKAVRVEGDSVSSSDVPDALDLSAAALDIFDREWVAGRGKLFVKDPFADNAWRLAWEDQSWIAPFVSLMADHGLVVGMTADGGVLEGRAMQRSA